MSAFKLPLTNVYGKGDYTAQLRLGSEQSLVNLLVDTGSSTLVVNPKKYLPEQDKSLSATSFVQEVKYGIGGWAGALVHSQVAFSENKPTSTNGTAENIAIAVVEDDPSNMFLEADGILGLAYHHLNKSYDLADYFAKQNITPALSYPWPFTINNKTSESPVQPPEFDDINTFQSFLWHYPEQDVTPFFTELVNQHKVANKFSFYSKRSSVHVDTDGEDIANNSTQNMLKDPLNNGWLILGGGEECTDLYQGEFKQVAVKHDVYYNVSIKSVMVGDNAPIITPPIDQQHVKNYYTNAIIDTGASMTVLTYEVYQQLLTQLEAINPDFSQLLEPFANIQQQYKGIDASQIQLEQWPDITFNFEGVNGENISLVCRPENYWQLNTPAKGKACFKLLSQLPNWPNQNIIGLPLISNYFTVFDRSEHELGVVKFASRL